MHVKYYQIRSGKIGLRHFLFQRRVPDYTSPGCPCGWHTQDPKHIVLFCERYAESRYEMLKSAGTNDWAQLTSTTKGLKAVTRWLMCTGLLGQFSLAADQLYSVQ